MTSRIIIFPDFSGKLEHEIKRLNNRLKKNIRKSRPVKGIKQKLRILSSKLDDSDEKIN